MLGLALLAMLVPGLTAPVPAIGELSPPMIDCGVDADSQACAVDATVDPACTRSPCPAAKATIVARNGGRGVVQAGVSVGSALGGLVAPPFTCASSLVYVADEAEGWGGTTCEFEYVGSNIRVIGQAHGPVWGHIHAVWISVYVYDPSTGYGFTGCEEYNKLFMASCTATLTGFPAQPGAKLVCGALGEDWISLQCQAS